MDKTYVGFEDAERVQAHLAAIIESSDDAIISKTLEGIITSWNATAVRLFGYAPEEAIGQHINLLIPKEREDEEFVIIGKVRNGQRLEHFETVRQRKDGSYIDISLTVSPIRNRAGDIIGVSKIARDITEQKRTEALLRDAGRRKDDFLANMSHELRTPMNAVIGLSHILGMSENLSPKEQQCVAMLKQSGENMLSLINNLLDFARLESGSLPLEAVEFSPAELVEKTIIMMQVKAQEKNLALRVSYDRELKDRYIGDQMRLQQVLINLVANAIKFTDSGHVEVRVRVRGETADSSALAFEVSDTGIGIAADKLELIFDKFMQADASMTRQYGGSGLGLSICRALAKAMGGELSVVSRPGIGSTFTVEVPLHNAGEQNLLTPDSGAAERPHHHVLVVEDYEPNTLVVTTLLERLGYSHDVAQNGMEALRKAERGRFDVILMDLQMPGMDGYEATRLIRDNETEHGLAPTPIIAMTAHVQARDKAQCLKAGMDDFIPKPFDPSVLKTIVARYAGEIPAAPLLSW